MTFRPGGLLGHAVQAPRFMRAPVYAGGSDPGPLVAGTIAVSVTDDTTLTVTETIPPSGGVAPITVVIYRHTATFTPPGTGTNVGTSFPEVDTGLTTDTEYFYEAIYTDAEAATANSNEVSATPAAPSAQWVPLFRGDWENPVPQLGTSQSAHRDDQDTGAGTDYKWTCGDALYSPYVTGGAELTDIIAAPAGVGWPCAKVLRINAENNGNFNVAADFPEQEIGERRGHRFIFHPYFNGPGSSIVTGSGRHGIQFDGGNGATQNANLTVVPQNGNGEQSGNFQFNFLVSSPAGHRYEYGPGSGAINVAHQPLHFEWHTERLDETTYRALAWIFQMNGTQLAGPTDFHRQFPLPRIDLTDPDAIFNITVPLGRAFCFGLNGLLVSAGTALYAWQGAPLVISSLDNPTWSWGTPIGPYGSGDGEVPV